MKTQVTVVLMLIAVGLVYLSVAPRETGIEEDFLAINYQISQNNVTEQTAIDIALLQGKCNSVTRGERMVKNKDVFYCTTIAIVEDKITRYLNQY